MPSSSPKYDIGSLVLFDSNIFEVQSTTNGNDGRQSYDLLLKASAMYDFPWKMSVNFVETVIADEDELQTVAFRKPKYSFNELVKYEGEVAEVEFIKYENYAYHYRLHRANDPYYLLHNGWLVEEGYLQK